ncbi:DUF397 domain-containing protein [Streptomyces sp. NBC_00846]|uniref:DUF397 domain-containing protein n=1 Tax=Streptomyces sp. NBC_00846 TaxID=2975849 RepID=UPI00386DACC3|nr:DUF397 domain-containing protein [Streptomyces sp. NBC_00846]
MAQDIAWQKSSFSGGGDSSNCVELAAAAGRIRLRESDDPCTELVTLPVALTQLFSRIKAGHIPRAL